MSGTDSTSERHQDGARSVGQRSVGQWLRWAFIRDDFDPKRTKPDTKGLNRIERRRAKVRHQMEGGRFRTWVYAAALLLFALVFALLIALS